LLPVFGILTNTYFPLPPIILDAGFSFHASIVLFNAAFRIAPVVAS
jgi:hypothetical protein